ncbi:MAG: AMP-binding protein [Planctomycetes bacterium]|nr:AMP-binding protein [Planctomycetota bacterium]
MSPEVQAARGSAPLLSDPSAGNIAAHLPVQAAARPDTRAIVLPRGRGRDGRREYAQASFRQLNETTDRYAHALKGLGVVRGDRVLILIKPGVELIAVIYAVFKLGAVAVFIDPGMGLKNLVAGIKLVAPMAFVGVSRAQAALTLLGRGALASVSVRALVGGGFGFGAVNLDQEAERASSEPFPLTDVDLTDPAAILFTSGSTGPAKGVVYEHGMFQAQVEHMRTVYGIAPGEVDLPGLPVFALFSVALGATTVFPDLDPTRPALLDPRLWVEEIHNHGVTYSFGSPAIWWPVMRHCQAEGLLLPSLKRVLMAGCPVPPALHEGLAKLLSPEARTHTPYGATEALPVSTIDGHALRETFAQTRAGAGVCVGRALPGVEIRIAAVSDGPLASWDEATILGEPGQRGEIVVAGPQVTKAYCELPEETAKAKIQDGERTWHRMGDLGYQDEAGRLWFLGRKAHRVEASGGRRMFPVACEAIFNEHERVYRSALVGLGEPGDQRPVMIVEPLPGQIPRGSAAVDTFFSELRSLGQAHPHTESIETFLTHFEFPVDLRHNAKIRREDLRDWAKGRA